MNTSVAGSGPRQSTWVSWDDERDISGGSDMRQHRGINLFGDNLRADLGGRPLTNVVDWADGY
jgi:hypothetical protein